MTLLSNSEEIRQQITELMSLIVKAVVPAAVLAVVPAAIAMLRQ